MKQHKGIKCETVGSGKSQKRKKVMKMKQTFETTQRAYTAKTTVIQIEE